MKIRPKTMRRVLVLLAVIAIIAGGITWLSILSIRRDRARVAAMRKEAFATYQAADYAKAVGLLGNYLDKGQAQDSDPDAVFAYGKARIAVPMPQNQQIPEGIHIFQHYLQLRPDDPDAQKTLLKLYVQANYNQEALALADQLLAAHPNDASALEGKLSALSNQRKFDQALVVSKRLNQASPAILRDQLATVWLMQAASKTPQEIIAYSQQLLRDHPDDALYEVVAAYACKLAGKEQDGRDLLQQASKRTPSDSSFVIALSRMLDQYGMYSDADGLVRRAAEKSTDLQLRRVLVERLWEDGDVPTLLERTVDLNPKSPASDSQLLSYRAAALYESDKAADAAQVLTALSARKADTVAVAGAAVLRAEYSKPPLAASQRLKLLQEAQTRDPGNAQVCFALGQAYQASGETELAIMAWKEAAAAAPNWASPWVLSSRVMLTDHRYADAVAAAEEAVHRAPGAQTLINYVRAAYVLATQAGDKAEYANLLGPVEQLQKLVPNEPQTLPIYVTILAHSNRKEDAKKALDSALAANPPLPAETLLQLALVSDLEKLDAGDALRTAARQTAGLTQPVALAEAMRLAQSGKPNDGLALLQSAAKGHETEIPWRLALASYKDSIGDPSALADWVSLGDQNPNDVSVQSAILRSPSRTRDRGFWERSITRMRALTDERGLVWRIERARFLLAGELTEKDKGEAVNLLTDATRTAPALPEPHRLLAMALMRANRGNAPRAISELVAAADASPTDPSITADLVALLIENGRRDDAIGYVERLTRSANLLPPVRHWVARQLATLGKVDQAIALLEDERKSAAADIDRDMLLAGFYRQSGKIQQAANLYRSLLDTPATDPNYYAQAADFFAARHDMATAQALLDRIEKMPLAAGEAELLSAQFAERWKTQSDALERYQDATSVATNSPTTWSALCGFFLRHQKFAQAAAAATEGLNKSPGSDALKALQRYATLLAGLPSTADLQPLIELLSRDPVNAEAAEMLGALAQVSQKSPGSTEALATKGQQIAEKYPQAVAVQLLAAQLLARSGQLQPAAKLAQRAASLAPTAVEPQALLADIYLASGDYDRAAQANARWRQLSVENPVAADLMAAQIYLQRPQRDPRAAIATLAPYLSAPLSQQQKDTALSLYCLALGGAGRTDEAAKILQPLLSGSRTWRLLWLELASAGQKDAAAANDWINRVAPLISDAVEEQVALARAWYEVGTKFDQSGAIEKSRDILKPIVTGSNATDAAWMAWALATQSLGDYATAEQGFRKVLNASPHSPDAQNDLAYVLWLRGRKEDLPEAQHLAASAVALAPNIASFYDTLARIQAATGQTDAAVKSFRTALQKDPSSLEAMIGLADLLAKDAARRSEARDLVNEITRRLKAATPLSLPLRKQLADVRVAVAESI